MATKNKNSYDADYDRWGAAPGSIKITKKPANKKSNSSKSVTKKNNKKVK